ncbi:MAG: hypothetical protein ABUK19_05455 [Desulfobacteria bacterium]
MKKVFAVGLFVLMAGPVFAENYLLNGGQSSQIDYQMVQKVQPLSDTQKFILSYVIPEDVDFLSSRGPAQQAGDGIMEMRKNFLVETAEYVTTKGQQYAQTFILTKPMQLKKAGLALHKFNEDGQLWLELFEDDGGKPGKYLSTSDIILLRQMKFIPGYSWVDFDFAGSSIVLSPGRYWVALGFTDSAIVKPPRPEGRGFPVRKISIFV